MSQQQSLQESFLHALQEQRIPVSIFLVNGIKLHGQIAYYNQEVVMLKNGITQMVFKHAISTIVPTRPITLSASDGNIL